MTEVSELIGRLEQTSEHDGALEHEIMLALGARYELDWGPEYYWPDGSRFYAHEFTKRIDDAVALLERIAPGWEWTLWFGGTAIIVPHCQAHQAEHEIRIEAASPSIALTIAALTAFVRFFQKAMPEVPK